MNHYNMTSPPLADNDICNQYTVTVRNKFDTLLDTFKRQTQNDKYKNSVTNYLENSYQVHTNQTKIQM